ncbi:MAG: nucleotidyltransferase domain-containing protein [Nanoarchaeota archaeon]|nr:nucleotidyltransferase domain-containing protein [Nanoarchaeota archaeon]MBU4086603.1 nucleotidyltransferase domain-containing protein [Nanoarchaeota archaeon]
MGKNELIAYALDAASYLVSRVEDIDRIILHGSAARGDFDEESDVDLFIDSDKKMGKAVDKTLESYKDTRKFREWQLKGVKNEISAITGKLDSEEWKDLKRSIINTGIILFGKYKAEAERVNHYVLVSFENIKPDKKRVSVFRKLFGFKVNDKRYEGLAKKINAVRVGKGSILVPIESFSKIRDYMKEKKIAVKVYDLWSDSAL